MILIWTFILSGLYLLLAPEAWQTMPEPRREIIAAIWIASAAIMFTVRDARK